MTKRKIIYNSVNDLKEVSKKFKVYGFSAELAIVW